MTCRTSRDFVARSAASRSKTSELAGWCVACRNHTTLASVLVNRLHNPTCLHVYLHVRSLAAVAWSWPNLSHKAIPASRAGHVSQHDSCDMVPLLGQTHATLTNSSSRFENTRLLQVIFLISIFKFFASLKVLSLQNVEGIWRISFMRPAFGERTMEVVFIKTNLHVGPSWSTQLPWFPSSTSHVRNRPFR